VDPPSPVIVHAANNSFGGWAEYNQMIGMGWRGNSFGDRLIVDDAGKEIRVPKGQGFGAGHGSQHAFYLGERDDHLVLNLIDPPVPLFPGDVVPDRAGLFGPVVSEPTRDRHSLQPGAQPGPVDRAPVVSEEGQGDLVL